MELTVLGKYGPYPNATGCASGYLVKNRGDLLVMDMGSGTLSRLMALTDIREVRHIFISHLHYDHTSDLLPFRYLLEELNHSVNIYVHREDTAWYRLLFSHPNFKVRDIDENTEIKAGSMTLNFLKMEHTSNDYAIIVRGEKTLSYTGDTVYNENVLKCLRLSDTVLADCSKPESFKGPHMTVGQAKELAEKYGAEIIATHLSASFDPTRELEGFENITVAQEMKTYII